MSGTGGAAGVQGARRSAAVAVGYTVLCALPLFLTSAFAVELQRDLGFGRAQLGWCVGAYFLVSSLASALIGGYLERAGPAGGMRAAAGMTVVTLLGTATVAGSWVHVALFLGLAGLANALAQVGSNLLLADGVPPRRQGLAFGFKQAAVPLASLLAGLALPALALTVGWRPTFAGIATVAAVAALRPLRVPAAAVRRRGGRGPRGAVLLLLAAAGACGGGVGNSLVNFTVDAAVTGGMAQAPAGLLLSLGAGTAIAARVGWGYLADRRDTPGFAELAGLMLAGAVGLTVLALAGPSVPLIVTGTLIGFGGAWGWQGLIYYVVVKRHPEAPAAATGLVQAGVYLGTIAGPPLVGYIATDFSYRVAWLLAAVVLTASGAIVLLARNLSARRAAGPGTTGHGAGHETSGATGHGVDGDTGGAAGHGAGHGADGATGRGPGHKASGAAGHGADGDAGGATGRGPGREAGGATGRKAGHEASGDAGGDAGGRPRPGSQD